MSKTRPGVMLYFDSLRPALKRLDDAQCGKLLRAVLDYAEFGLLTELDAMTGMAFEMQIPKIDRDGERYEACCEQRQFAAYSREVKRRGEQPISFEEWRRKESTTLNEPWRPVTDEVQSLPSISTSSSSAPSLSQTTTASAPGAGVVEGEEAGCKGEGEGDPHILYQKWLDAMDRNELGRAFEISNLLFRKGFYVDQTTREMVRR